MAPTKEGAESRNSSLARALPRFPWGAASSQHTLDSKAAPLCEEANKRKSAQLRVSVAHSGAFRSQFIGRVRTVAWRVPAA